eukprot:CAMPEP_0174277612 /NCGR_PEP_ID=MMETSP0439-20130205/61029_1 /TAXON_ID=0 /ORGANISM="Stereomyxa ramosa, Strain Chinc5" /LENGTH=215 /DNA_ID=CAMNT_0015369949 /DNA_START=465 /DNA_END=1112 /DNA_ORIENTATION=-
MSISITLVAESSGRVIEVAEREGRALETAQQIVQKVNKKKEDKKVFDYNGFYYFVLISNQTVFLCVASDSSKQRICWSYLLSIKKYYDDSGIARGGDTEDFRSYVVDQMDLYTRSPEEVDKIAKTQGKVKDLTNIMMSNIELLLERGDKLEDTLNQTSELQKQSHHFSQGSRKLKLMECRRSYILGFVLCLCCLLLIAIVIVIIVVLVMQFTGSE